VRLATAVSRIIQARLKGSTYCEALAGALKLSPLFLSLDGSDNFSNVRNYRIALWILTSMGIATLIL
jgi:hypothetical protein